MSKTVDDSDRHASQLASLCIDVDALTDKAQQIDELISQLKTGDRLYVPQGGD